MPDTSAHMLAAYVAAAVIYLGYSAYLLAKGRRRD
jgi:hypothetical protein